jgi:hypothetical protein
LYFTNLEVRWIKSHAFDFDEQFILFNCGYDLISGCSNLAFLGDYESALRMEE